jgi:hypothetical protein
LWTAAVVVVRAIWADVAAVAAAADTSSMT